MNAKLRLSVLEVESFRTLDRRSTLNLKAGSYLTQFPQACPDDWTIDDTGGDPQPTSYDTCA